MNAPNDRPDTPSPQPVSGLSKWRAALRRERPETPSEYRRVMVEAIERALEGFHGVPFPFGVVEIHLWTEQPLQQSLYEQALTQTLGGRTFDEAVLHALRQQGHQLPAALRVVPFGYTADNPPPPALAARFQTAQTQVLIEARRVVPEAARLVVLKGVATLEGGEVQSAFPLPIDRRCYLGRSVDFWHEGYLERRNTLAFLDQSDPRWTSEIGAINQSVSRRHAYIAYQPEQGGYVFVQETLYGSAVFRDGRSERLMAGQSRLLRSGDLLFLGDAQLRFESANAA